MFYRHLSRLLSHPIGASWNCSPPLHLLIVPCVFNVPDIKYNLTLSINQRGRCTFPFVAFEVADSHFVPPCLLPPSSYYVSWQSFYFVCFLWLTSPRESPVPSFPFPVWDGICTFCSCFAFFFFFTSLSQSRVICSAIWTAITADWTKLLLMCYSTSGILDSKHWFAKRLHEKMWRDWFGCER